MPMLNLQSTGCCVVCGRRLGGFLIGTYRINKHSLVSTGKSPELCWQEGKCRECGHPSDFSGVERYRLSPESLALVNAARSKRGWEPWSA